MRMYLTQTFFDDDEDFEFIQSDRTVIPITVKTQDYINEHSENSTEEVGENQSASDENEWWRDYGAEGCSMEWDNERKGATGSGTIAPFWVASKLKI